MVILDFWTLTSHELFCISSLLLCLQYVFDLCSEFLCFSLLKNNICCLEALFHEVNKLQLPEKKAFHVKVEHPALEPKAVGGCGCVGVICGLFKPLPGVTVRYKWTVCVQEQVAIFHKGNTLCQLMRAGGH